MKDDLQSNLENFLRHIDSIKDTLPMAIILIEPYNKTAIDNFASFLKSNVKEVEDFEGKQQISINPSEFKKFELLERNASTSSLAPKIISESLFVSLISQYDAFLSRILRIIFEIKPEILSGSDKNLTFSQLTEFKTIEKAKEHIAEKEVEAVLRKSHSEHFDYLENKLGMKLRENQSLWRKFIEITERRNLFVHCDGVVSNQYLQKCSIEGCEINDYKLGDKLDVKIEYFSKAHKCLYELSVTLTHTIWRKMLKEDLSNADKELNNICFDLISAKSFELADTLLSFACNQKKHADDFYKNILIINHALSKYLQNKNEDVKMILSSKDWSACSDKFKLAYEILMNDYKKAYVIMKRIGRNGDIEDSEYKGWPLFIKIREEKEFKDIYKEIFEEEYSVTETPLRPVLELIHSILKKKTNAKKNNPQKKNRNSKKS